VTSTAVPMIVSPLSIRFQPEVSDDRGGGNEAIAAIQPGSIAEVEDARAPVACRMARGAGAEWTAHAGAAPELRMVRRRFTAGSLMPTSLAASPKNELRGDRQHGRQPVDAPFCDRNDEEVQDRETHGITGPDYRGNVSRCPQ
jgi:hypothetical protein